MSNNRTKPRLNPDHRRSLIKQAIIRMTGKITELTDINHETVADECSIETSASTVRHYFHTNADLWRVAIENAKSENLTRQGNDLGLS